MAATCLASVGASCPQLEEIRFRGASLSYSAERVSARSELLRHTDMMAMMQGAPNHAGMPARSQSCMMLWQASPC